MKLKSNEPFWLVKNGILHSYPSLKEDISTDILIVGGGITGSLIAHRCMEEGYQTVVVDRREIAHGSTSATTSMLQYEIDVPLYRLIKKIGEAGAVASYKACYKSIDDLGLVAKKVRSASGFQKKQSLYFAAYKKDVRWLRQEWETRKKYGFQVRWLNGLDIENKFSLSHTFGGILSRQGGSVDAFQLAHDILAFNYKKGLKIYDKTEIVKTCTRRYHMLITTDTGHQIKAKKIIYCNGFESTELIKDKFVKLTSTYAVVGERAGSAYDLLKDTLVWNTSEPYLYMRTTDDNRLLVGGEDEDFANAQERDSLLGQKVLRLERKVHRLVPNSDFTPDFAWAGTFGCTKDGLPYIGVHSDFPRSYFVLGFGGNGITFSVIAMDMVADMLRGKKHPLTEYFCFGR